MLAIEDEGDAVLAVQLIHSKRLFNSCTLIIKIEHFSCNDGCVIKIAKHLK